MPSVSSRTARKDVMEPKKIEDLIDKVFERDFKRIAAVCCDPAYYKNKFLQYAMENEDSLQCIVRAYMEMLKTASPYTKNGFDIWQINQLLVYLDLYQDRDILDYVSRQMAEMSEMSQDLPENFYIIRKNQGRFKSFRSLESKLRINEVSRETLRYMIRSLNSITDFKDLNTEEKNLAGEILQERLDETEAKDPVKDLIGYRYIIHSYNLSTEDKDIVPFLYETKDKVKAFCGEKGFVISVFKDYIKKPKDTGYQSLHLTIDIVGKKIELQIRTGAMHENAEHGSSSHDGVYKNTPIHNFLENFMFKISKKLGRLSRNEHIGLTEGPDMFNLPVCMVPNFEVPRTPDGLKDFTDLEFIQKTVEHSPMFDKL